MSQSYTTMAGRDIDFDENATVMQNIFNQYEKVVIQSLITSFGLDFFINDRHGGDVDTIHNVRQMGSDNNMTYKNSQNKFNYEQNGQYDSHLYHSHAGYIQINREAKEQKVAGTLRDEYTDELFTRNAKTNLDHVISAKEIHGDRGRILSGLSGYDLANSTENLKITNEHTNKSKKADSMESFLQKKGLEYTEQQKCQMRNKDRMSRESYETKLFIAYYTSPNFFKDTAIAAGTVAIQMGLRQAFGLVFAEIWFSIKEEFAKLQNGFSLEKFFMSIGDGIKRGIERAKSKYKEIFSKLQEGLIAGALGSISTTLCNIFFTTAKNVVKIVRQTWASIVEAIKILIFNPDNLLFGDRIKAAVKVLTVGASIVTGSIVNEMVAKSPLGTIPVVGETVAIFCGTLVTGIMSCTLLFVLDRSDLVKHIVAFLNSLSMENVVNQFKQQADYLENYVAKLAQIDLNSFKQEVTQYHNIVLDLDSAKSEQETCNVLMHIYAQYKIHIPWTDDFNTFMSNRSNRLVFE